MKSRHTLLAALGVFVLGVGATMACTSPQRLYGTTSAATSSGTGGGSTGTGVGGSAATTTSSGMTMSTGTGTTTDTPCVDTSLCPGKDTECQVRVCVNSFCGIQFAAAGKAVSAQFTGDCQQIVCDGQDAVIQQADSTDIPDDSNPCTLDVCTAGVPSHPAAASGTSCGVGLTCNNLGNCIGCTGPADCPGQDTDCQTRSCTTTVCGFVYKPSGTLVTTQVPTDCKQNVCNGMGAVSVTFDSNDLEDDGNPCTLDACSNGSPTHAFLPPGADCFSKNGSKVCDGSGTCVHCVMAADCPGQDGECSTRSCVAGTCGVDYAPSGKPVAIQTAGDCYKGVCNGSGAPHQVVDDTDAVQDGNPCTVETCSNGGIIHTPVAVNTPCGGNNYCDAAGNCTGCLTAADCAGTDTECQVRACASGVCGFSFTAVNTPVASQTGADCKKNVCDGAGGVKAIADDADVFIDPNQCTADICSGGTPSNPPAGAGTPCSAAPGGVVCNGNGICGECSPGDFQLCGCQDPFSCCFLPNLTSHADALTSMSDDPGAVPDMPCCCNSQSKFCDNSGTWGECF